MADLKKGDKVTCSAHYTYDGSTHLASFVNTTTYEVIQVGGKNLPDDRVVIGLNGVVTAAVKASELTNISAPATPAPDPPVSPPPPAPPAPAPKPPQLDANALVDQMLSGQSGFSVANTSTPGGGVMLPQGKNRASGEGSESYWSTINAMIAAKYANEMSAAELNKLDSRDPSLVQNSTGFPRSKGMDVSTGYYRYNYYMDYDADGMTSGLQYYSSNGIRKASNIDVISRGDLVQKYYRSYNKFKLLNANDVLAHSFGHVFFVRPDCNILQAPNALANDVKSYSDFYYALKQAPFLLQELCQSAAGKTHEFALYLSNKARSFEVSDEYITSNTYGESLTGFKIPYGKSTVESQAAGKFSITYHDDRDLHVYHLHRLWTNYISYVYRGKVYPKESYIFNKVLDYPTCVYYILTAEDGETIIFWSKYWGVFPLEAPSSGFSFNLDNAGGVSNPELKVEYQYAWKEDFNPLSMIEFNTHTQNLTPYRFVPSYQEQKVGTGYTWSGPPFVETVSNPNGLDLPYTFKLRFRPE